MGNHSLVDGRFATTWRCPSSGASEKISDNFNTGSNGFVSPSVSSMRSSLRFSLTGMDTFQRLVVGSSYLKGVAHFPEVKITGRDNKAHLPLNLFLQIIHSFTFCNRNGERVTGPFEDPAEELERAHGVESKLTSPCMCHECICHFKLFVHVVPLA